MIAQLDTSEWVDDYSEDDDANDNLIQEYDIAFTPIDFNVKSLVSFIDDGYLEIPGFQRNYVWDIGMASRFIESLILGLPVPQIFLFEKGFNKFLVIDGQQRLMSIFYFAKGRFPKTERRGALRAMFDREGTISDKALEDDDYFTDFRLSLSGPTPSGKRKLQGLDYCGLGEYSTRFDSRPIRNVVVKQGTPREDYSAVYEIFHRLNSGGVNLTPQEIRASLYHSEFYDMLSQISRTPAWLKLTGRNAPDLRMKDIEIILRGFAMLINGDSYAPSMVKFLNQFSDEAQHYDSEKIEYLKSLFDSFLTSASELPERVFQTENGARFSIALFEAVFVAACARPYKDRRLVDGRLSAESVSELREDEDFIQASRVATTQSANVRKRLSVAAELVRVI